MYAARFTYSMEEQIATPSSSHELPVREAHSAETRSFAGNLVHNEMNFPWLGDDEDWLVLIILRVYHHRVSHRSRFLPGKQYPGKNQDQRTHPIR